MVNGVNDIESFGEKPVRFGEFLTNFIVESADTPADKAPEVPDFSSLLSYLRIELIRTRPGMGDFIVRCATPVSGPESKNVIVSIRGNASMAKLDGVSKLAQVIQREMLARNDVTFKWDKLDREHLVDMLAIQLKFFCTNRSSELLHFTTEALSEVTKDEE